MAVTRDVSKLSGWLNERAAANMPVMSVSLEVSQLEISALKLDKLWKTPAMLEMAETSQSAMGPYLAMVAFGSLSNSWAALLSQYELLKT